MSGLQSKTKFTHINDLNGLLCVILKDVVARNALDKNVTFTNNYVLVLNSDGSEEYLFPWELTELGG